MPAVGVGLIDTNGIAHCDVRGVADVTCNEPVSIKHYWDLASLTKTLVLLPAILELVDAGRLALDRPIGEQWPRVQDQPVAKATLAQMLQYNADLPPWYPYHLVPTSDVGHLEHLLLATPLQRAPGEAPMYSDLGAMQLGLLVSEMHECTLSTIARASCGLIFGPGVETAVATEQCHWRGRLLKGEVHDENAAALGGQAGHAGAFGTLKNVLREATMWLNAEVVSPELHRECFSRSVANKDGDHFGLGWWLPNTRGIGGTKPGPGSWGHSGFVGNRLWFEPSRGYALVILSNRIHPKRGTRDPFDKWCRTLLDVIADAYSPS